MTRSKTRRAYVKHLSAVFALAGMTNNEKRAQAVYDFAYKIAQASWANADRNNVDKIFNPMTVSQLEAFAPAFPWDPY